MLSNLCFVLVFQASTDQTNIDLTIPLFLGMTIVMYFNLVSILVVTCVYAWPTVVLLVPSIWLNLWYRVCLAMKFVGIHMKLIFSLEKHNIN